MADAARRRATYDDLLKVADQIWVCEVLSPSTAARDRADKVPSYLREEVSYVCLVDPGTQTLEAFKRDGVAYRLLGTWRANAVVRVEPFEALDLDLSALLSK